MKDYNNYEEEYDQPVDVIGTLLRYISNWKWFLISVALCVSLAMVYLKFKLPTYKVSTTVLLKDDQRGSGNSEINAFKEIGLFTQKNNVDNELEVLKSQNIVEMAVRELGLNTSYAKEGTLPIVKRLGDYAGIENLGYYKEKCIYGSECPVLVNLAPEVLDTLSKPISFEILVRPTGVYEFTGKHLGKKYKANASISDQYVLLPFGILQLKRGAMHPKSDMKLFVQITNPLQKATELMGYMRMELTSKTTSVVIITLKTRNKIEGKAFLSKFIEVYNREDLNDQAAMAAKTAEFIDERLMTLAQELDDVEVRVEDYKQGHGLTDIKSESTMFLQQTGNFTQKQADIETQLAVISEIDNYMHRKENIYQLIPASSGIKSQGLSELINNFNRLVLQRNRLSRIASSSNQAMMDLTNQIESMYSTVQASVRNEKMNLQIAQRDLQMKNNENTSRIRAIPRQEREYTEIKRQQSVKEALFLFLLQKKEEKYVNLSVVEPTAKVIDNAHGSSEPITPNKSLVLLFSVIIGLIMPVGGLKINDLLRYQISNKEELEDLTDVPVLGEIPRNSQKNDIIIKENHTDSFSELIRLLRTNLLFVMDSTDKQVINVVSSISGEGKTYIAVNLAMSLAMLDKKVLVIGLDIRKPKLAECLGIEDKNGITLYLTGQLNSDKLVQASGLHDNLSVILSGPIPPNPNELLAKKSLDKLITEMRSHFDYIVIDTAPILVVSDSFILNRFADVNLYLVRADFTPKKNIDDAATLYKQNKLKNFYFVMNGTDRSKFSYRTGSGKKYGYGYRKKQTIKYGYGYIDENVKEKSII